MSILSHCTIRGIGNVPKCHTSSQIPLSLGWIGQFGNIPKHPMQYALSLLSIPSQCTMGWIGQNGDVPRASHAVCTIPWKSRRWKWNWKEKEKGKYSGCMIYQLRQTFSPLFIEVTCMSSARNSELYSAFKVMIS